MIRFLRWIWMIPSLISKRRSTSPCGRPSVAAVWSLRCGLRPVQPDNQLHWQMMERGEITREQVLVDRFAMLFRELGKTADPVAVARSYEKLLGVGHYYLPGAEQTLKQELFGKYRLFLVSNGTASVQHSRLESAGLYPYFEQVFISEELGSHKPEPAFFDACFAKIPDFDRTQALMVGDSLTSDILGGIRSGLRTCWVNPQGKDAPPEIQPDYQIQGLSQLPALLEKSCDGRALVRQPTSTGSRRVMESGVTVQSIPRICTPFSGGFPQGKPESGVCFVIGVQPEHLLHLDHENRM